MGGETMLLLGGAGLTTSYFDIGSSWKQVTRDPRIKAAVGYVPYFGQPILPAFGRDQHGLDGINLPFLGISGTADTTAPITETKIGMSRLTGTRELVALSGVTHGFDDASTNDIFTWMLTFLDAEVRGNPETKSSSRRWGAWRAEATTASCFSKTARHDVTRARRRIDAMWSSLGQEMQHVCSRFAAVLSCPSTIP